MTISEIAVHAKGEGAGPLARHRRQLDLLEHLIDPRAGDAVGRGEAVQVVVRRTARMHGATIHRSPPTSAEGRKSGTAPRSGSSLSRRRGTVLGAGVSDGGCPVIGGIACVADKFGSVAICEGVRLDEAGGFGDVP